MKLTDCLHKNDVIILPNGLSKWKAIQYIVKNSTAVKLYELDPEEIITALMEREECGSTGIRDGYAIPHGKLSSSKLFALFALSKEGINWDALDGKPVYLIFTVIAPENSVGIHLKMLARMCRMLGYSDFRKKLLESNSSHELYQVISEEDAKY